MEAEKAINKISVSLLNSWLYYLLDTSDITRMEQLKNAICGIFIPNEWTIRGSRFESAVFAGKHDKLSALVMPLKKQVWCNKEIVVDGVSIKLSGKLDAIDKEKSRIYDIKRKNKFDEADFNEDHTLQHIIYFYLNPDIKDFFYLVASGYSNDELVFSVVHKERPEEAKLEQLVLTQIHNFFEFMKEHDLYELYLTKQVTKPKKFYKYKETE
jgi:hypothetical protein